MTQSYIERPVSDYLADASSNKPAPGGGSVSAMVGALGMTMAEMALNFTIGKKKYADVEEEAKGLLAEITACRKTCEECVDRDVASYAQVSAAYGMPRETEQEKRARTEAIQEALKVAMGPPLETFRALVAVMPAIRRCVDVANQNLISDVGVAAVHAGAAIQGARLNVDINLASMKDPDTVGPVRDEIEKGYDEALKLVQETHRLVSCKVAGS